MVSSTNTTKSTKKPCCKCKTETATLLIRQAYYCQSCFMFVFIGKYRSILLRLRNNDRKNGKVLLACSGGPSSIAMVNLTKNFMRVVPSEKKKVQLIPEAIVCHIDESTLFESTAKSSEKLAQDFKQHYSEFEYFSYRLEEVFGPEFTKSDTFDKILKSTSGGIENGEYEHYVKCVQSNSNKSQAEQLKQLFTNIKKTTAKEDLLWNIKMEMLVTVARREGCPYIFMADSATRQAIKMISMTSKGRGYSVALDVSVDNTQSFKDLCIMRPMKDMLSKEIGFYNHFANVAQFETLPYNFSTMMPGKTSIDRLTEEFIVSIEQEFPSTVSTICRTVMKLTPAANMDLTKTCAICLMPLEADIGAWRQHITVADVLDADESKIKQQSSGCGDCSGPDGGCCSSGSTADKEPRTDMNKFLCYSCQVNLKDYNEESIASLPPYVAENVCNQSRDSRLLSQIKDFLIEDSDDEE
ncbi:cytoplasmic tRNA 2-thiolation protein 2-like [Mucor ambiguus]|uniref:Cytoplasmic tRNA 2-thiolation protein 2 n=1 Tax=Mucor ambiguus TaxID=91626 RepID=A0A0C9LP98_9FUNG|nr:cytoplasmic tRNA 2-thiolation protein 2-like [Mucor ambiguus]